MKISFGNDQRNGPVAGEDCRVKVIIITMMMVMVMLGEGGNLYGDENDLADRGQFMGQCSCAGESRRSRA